MAGGAQPRFVATAVAHALHRRNRSRFAQFPHLHLARGGCRGATATTISTTIQGPARPFVPPTPALEPHDHCRHEAHADKRSNVAVKNATPVHIDNGRPPPPPAINLQRRRRVAGAARLRFQLDRQLAGDPADPIPGAPIADTTWHCIGHATTRCHWRPATP